MIIDYLLDLHGELFKNFRGNSNLVLLFLLLFFFRFFFFFLVFLSLLCAKEYSKVLVEMFL